MAQTLYDGSLPMETWYAGIEAPHLIIFHAIPRQSVRCCQCLSSQVSSSPYIEVDTDTPPINLAATSSRVFHLAVPRCGRATVVSVDTDLVRKWRTGGKCRLSHLPVQLM